MARRSVVVALATVALSLSSAAFAANSNTIDGYVKVDSVSLNGHGATIYVQPGADVSITTTLTRDASSDPCPGCIVFVPVAFKGAPTPAGCLNDPNDGLNGTQTATVDLGPAPTTPGTYAVNAQAQEDFFCEQQYSPDGGDTIATVVVLAPKPPAPAASISLHAGKYRVNDDTSAHLFGRVHPTRAGRRVAIQELNARGWHTVRRTTERRSGRFSTYFHTEKLGRHQFRARVATSGGHHAISKPITIRFYEQRGTH